MVKADEARELLFAANALRLGLVDRGGLDRSLSAWLSNRARPLSRLLVEKGGLKPKKVAAVEAEVASALKTHQGDAHRALAAIGPVAEELTTIVSRHASFDTIGGGVANFDTIGDDPTGTTSQPASLDLPDTIPATGTNVSNGGPPKTEVAGDGVGETVALGASGDGTERPGESRKTYNEFGPTGETIYPPGHHGHAETDEEAFGKLLRYRILRLHAKGGLGEVFVARDEELHREVALKEIQGRYAGDEESRMRFLIEAEVTGNLEHPGIVPVYGLGRYPDGRPYYAMRFIRGESLRDAIARFHQAEAVPGRDPGERAMEFRKLLGQLVDVCNAMAYAHSRGVLHRDLKPGNVMLGSFGETLVVDWGLAKFKDTPEEAPSSDRPGPIRPMSAGASGRTQFGSAVGTPQYMSPEQAAGQLDRLGPATDIYSLGAILYTILVGNPPFLDKQLAVMLYKVSQGDFPPPRALNSSIPPALDAVCRKAMALNPDDRYATSNALADDLEHWLADEPVSVYREPLPARVARWARRHKTAVAATAALLVTAVLSLAVYSVLIKRERDRTERFYVLARQAVDEMLTQLGAEDLANVPQMEPVRARMLREAKAFYEQLRLARAGDRGAERDVALATLRLADIEALLGDKSAPARYDDAIGKLRALVAASAKTGDRDASADLARALHARGLLDRKLNRLDDAERDFSAALGSRRNLAAKFPNDPAIRRGRTDSLYHLAALHDRVGRVDDAKAEYGEVIAAQTDLVKGPTATLDDLRLLARYMNNLANLLAREKGKGRDEAKRLYTRALEAQKGVVDRDRETAFYRYELAKTHGNLRIVLAADGDLAGAEAHAVEDVDLSRKLADDFRKVPDYRVKLATARSNLGELRLKLKEFDRAEPELDAALAIAEDLVASHEGVRDYRSVLAAALVNRAALRELTKRDPEAEAELVKARAVLEPIATRETPAAEDVFDLGTVFYKLARVRSRLKRPDEALADVDRAAALHERAQSLGRAGDGEVPFLWSDVSLRCDLLLKKGEYSRCADACERLPAISPDYARSYVLAARMLAFACDDAARHTDDLNYEERARGFASRALKQLRDAARRNLLDAGELDNPYYARPRQFFPDEFRSLSDDVKRRNRA